MEIDMIVHTYEEDGRSLACKGALLRNAEKIGLGRALVLPIPTTRDKIHLKGSEILLEDIVKDADGDTLAIGYGMPEGFASALTARGASVYDAELDESFLERNAELTALATLGILLTSEKRALRDLSFGIVGFGRIGRLLARMLLFHGAAVKIYTSKSRTLLELGGVGLSCETSGKDADLSSVDILINTAPAVIFTDGVPSGIRVIDLASGDNFPGTGVEKYPSVPAKMFPVSAGEALALGAVSFISERGRCI